MKTINTSQITALVLFLGTSTLTLSAATVSDDFNTDNYTSNFNQNPVPTAGPPAVAATYVWQSTAGYSGAGTVGVATSADASTMYNTLSFALNTGATASISENFRYFSGLQGNKAIQLGFDSSTGATFSTTSTGDFITGRVVGTGSGALALNMQWAVNSGGTNTSSNVAVTTPTNNGDWLNLTFQFADSGGSFGWIETLTDLTSSTTLGSTSGGFTSSALDTNLGAHLWTAGWRQNAGQTTAGGGEAFNNFTATDGLGGSTPVPEPSTYAMLGLGLFALEMVRRRSARAKV